MAQNCDPQSLVNSPNVQCIYANIPPGMQLPVLISLLCQIVNNGTGGSSGVIGDGTLFPASLQTTLALNTQAKNLMFSGPSSGANAAPTFRSMVNADLPYNTASGVALEVIPIGSYLGPSSLAIASQNTVYFRKMMVPGNTNISSFTFDLTVGVGGGFSGFGLYTIDGNTKLVDTGAISSTVAAQGNIKTTFTAVPVPAGEYIFAWTANSTTIAMFMAGAGNATSDSILNAGPTPFLGTAANVSVGGVLPATLGALTGVTSQRTPIAVWGT